MKPTRPISITVLSVLLVTVGLIGLVYHATEFKTITPFPYELLLVELVRVLAIFAGIYIFLGRNWARWLALGWIAFHVAVGALHSTSQFLMHVLVLAIFCFVLLRPSASSYFRASSSSSTAIPPN